MADVLMPPTPVDPTSPTSPVSNTAQNLDIPTSDAFPPATDSRARARPRSRISNSARSARLSTLSRRTSHSRPPSSIFPAFPSSLEYANVRDFAYPQFHPMHYGPPPEPPSGTTTPGSEWNSSRRLSDPMDAWNGGGRNGSWGAGPWGGDGVMYSDPAGGDGESLPATSFGEELEDDGTFPRRKGKHRKSKSYTDISDLERGRRHESGTFNRRSRVSGDGGDAYFSASASPPLSGNNKFDPAGQGSLRQSRNYGRRDFHSGMLPTRSFHTGHLPDADEDLLPLDAEQSLHAQSPHRASMGPEDELYAGESLALYAFEPENPNELRLKEGQVILVSYRHGQGWLVAEDPATGEQGLVPEEYVRLVSEIQSWDHERGQFIEDDSIMLDDSTQHHERSSSGLLNISTNSLDPGHFDHADAVTPIGKQIDESEAETPRQRPRPAQQDGESEAGQTTNKPEALLEESRQDSAHGEL